MNIKLVAIGLLASVVVVMIVIGILKNPESKAPVGTYVDEDFVVTRPDVQARPDTFNIMTPEEKAVADAELARLAAETALSASSSASSTATTTAADGEAVISEEPPEQL